MKPSDYLFAIMDSHYKDDEYEIYFSVKESYKKFHKLVYSNHFKDKEKYAEWEEYHKTHKMSKEEVGFILGLCASEGISYTDMEAKDIDSVSELRFKVHDEYHKSYVMLLISLCKLGLDFDIGYIEYVFS